MHPLHLRLCVALALTLIDQMIEEAFRKLKALGDLETVNEKQVTAGPGIEYPGSF